MGIQTKIEEIRRQPERVRMRYVLTSVFVSMLVISVLWIFSITTSFQSQKEIVPAPMNQGSQNQDMQAGAITQQPDVAPSLDEWIKK
ncbi:MAG: hypothetical protein PHT88_03070 [Candidatus Moranbacteria bacterium]|nr:hypothetical protein [Candidatus Moranbacteria bacterium]